MATYTIQLKRGKASSWLVLDPVLTAGEPGFEIDTGKLKIGNGIDNWTNLSYLGENKSFIINANTRFDFPAIGEIDVIYKASDEKQLYQWNNESYEYELLYENIFVTPIQLEEALQKLQIPEISLEDYATKAYAQELFDKMIPLVEEEILEACK